MLFMVIEHFKHGDPKPVGERFREKGRMLPEGVIYHSSWMDSTGARCFQLMEAAQLEMLRRWIARWEDLIEFEIFSVQPSAEFWSGQRPGQARSI